MTELVLAYIGTMLIGFEFIRKLTKFQTLLCLVAAWPFGPLINAFPLTEHEREIFKSQKQKFTIKFIFGMIYGILLIIFLMPLTVISFVVNLVIGLINTFNQVLNLLYRRSIERFRPFSMKLANMIIRMHKRYEGLSAEEVIKNVKETEVPFPPIVGVILITTAFIMQIVQS